MDAHCDLEPPKPPLRPRIQMIFQDPYASLNPRWIVEDIVGEPLKEHRLITDEAELKARVGAAAVGGPEPSLTWSSTHTSSQVVSANASRLPGACDRTRVPGV